MLPHIITPVQSCVTVSAYQQGYPVAAVSLLQNLFMMMFLEPGNKHPPSKSEQERALAHHLSSSQVKPQAANMQLCNCHTS
jgi:hypothetical protein